MLARNIRKTDVLFFLLVFLISLLPRLFLFHTEFWRTPDAIEYLNVAENITKGNGLTQSIKWHFFDNSPVIISALKGKPIFTSIIFSLILYIKNDPYILQVFILFLGSLNTSLFYSLARKFCKPKTAFISSMFIGLNPNILITNRLILSEPILLFFVLLFFLFFYSKKIKSSIFLGILAGLAYLTRFEGIWLLGIALLRPPGRNPSGFLLITLLFFYFNFKINGSPFYTYNSYHFHVMHFSEGMENGYGKIFPTAFEFIQLHIPWILQRILSLSKYYLNNLINFSFLGFLSFFASVSLFTDISKRKRFAPIIAFSFLTFASFPLLWSAFTEPERHLIVIYVLLFLTITPILEKLQKDRITQIILIFTFCVYIIFDIHRISWTRKQEPLIDNYGYEDKKVIYTWINNHAEETNIIAAPNPWMMYLNTRHPAILLPKLIRQTGDIGQFAKEYHAQYVLLPKTTKIQQGKLKVSSTNDSLYCLFGCGK